MTFLYNTENISELLRKQEIEELRKYCESQGFSEEDTEIFVNNSLKNLYDE